MVSGGEVLSRPLLVREVSDSCTFNLVLSGFNTLTTSYLFRSDSIMVAI